MSVLAIESVIVSVVRIATLRIRPPCPTLRAASNTCTVLIKKQMDTVGHRRFSGETARGR